MTEPMIKKNSKLEKWSWIAGITAAIVAIIALFVPMFVSDKPGISQKAGDNSPQIANNSGTVIIGSPRQKDDADSDRPFLTVEVVPWGPNDTVIQPLADVRIVASGKFAASNIAVACSTSLDRDTPWRQSDQHVNLKFPYMYPNASVPINCGIIQTPNGEIKQIVVVLGLITYDDENKKGRHREEARALLSSIDTSTLTGLRDRALIAVMIYTFARVGAVLQMNVGSTRAYGP